MVFVCVCTCTCICICICIALHSTVGVMLSGLQSLGWKAKEPSGDGTDLENRKVRASTGLSKGSR